MLSFACAKNSKEEGKKELSDTGVIPVEKKMCFESISTYKHSGRTYADVLTIVININGSKVTGYHDWIPAEKDENTGPFVGSINEKGIIEVIQTASGEGETYKEEIHFKVAENQIYEKWQSPLDKKDGVYVDPSWGDPTPQVDCNKLYKHSAPN